MSLTDCQIEFDVWVKRHGRANCQHVIKRFNRQRLEQGDSARPKRKPLSPGKRRDLYAKQDGKCAVCGEPFPISQLTDDHWDVNATDYNAFKNRRLACTPCNSTKNANSIVDEAKRLGVTVHQMVEEQNKIHQ